MPGFLERVLFKLCPWAASHLDLPEFLGIGAQKAGTTWLAENLRRHPDVFVPRSKELHWFDAHWGRTLREYARIFASAGEHVRGEITPAYSILPPERIRFIRTVMPDARLILLLRNPVERAWSHALMDLAVRRGRRPDKLTAEEVIAHLEQHYVAQRGDYTTILNHWLDEFPEDQLLVGFFEDIRDRPRVLLEQIFRHLGVTTKVDWSEFPLYERIAPAVEPELKDAFVDMKGFSSPLAEQIPPPDAVRTWLRHRYERPLKQLSERLGDPATDWMTSLDTWPSSRLP